MMTGPPSPKRQRIHDNESDENESKIVKEVLEKVQKVEEELEQMNVEQAKEILVIEAKYNMKKHSTYVKRNKILNEIPHFWKKVFENHMPVNGFITEDDKKIFDYLQTFDVTFVGDDGTFKMEMTFKENPYFSPTTLWKQVKFSVEEEETEVTTSEITWKEKEETTEEPTRFFFDWFTTTDGEQEMAEIIKEEIWKYPVRYFLMDEDDDEDEEDQEEEDEDEEEEENKQEGESDDGDTKGDDDKE
ncbi:unnamed protein product [Peronospora farinosa]|uniref:Protein SET n=1 Tax=Peronospora farinosa TaxID=134698 RepID=A0AAV0T0X1_9STRA|nr:unnamed protein product [Peronospora farinosa]CAI5710158.1 unnamed protein product [Peronospora farinosa]